MKVGYEFKKYTDKKVAEKITALLNLLQIDSIPVKKTGLLSRINEYTTFRNEIFHDRSFGNPVIASFNGNLMQILAGGVPRLAVLLWYQNEYFRKS